jgi:hypothetical protein
VSVSPADDVILPRASEAVVPHDKLRRYALDPGHRTGADKARVFGSALGLRAADWRYLRDQILERVVDSPVMAIRPKPHMASSTRFA